MVIAVHMVAWYCQLRLVTAGVVVDLRVVVPVPFLYSVVAVVVIDSFGLLVVFAVLYVRLVHYW